MMSGPSGQYVGRGGLKLQHALQYFSLDPAGQVCADFGCNVGGFTDCLLQHGASRVFAVDTGYGALAWKLRQDPRVVVMERTNALHVEPPRGADGGPGIRNGFPAPLRRTFVGPSMCKMLDSAPPFVSMLHVQGPRRRPRRQDNSGSRLLSPHMNR